MKPEHHYYEAHVNLGPVKRPEALQHDLAEVGLKIVDLVGIKLPGLESEEFGIITTMHETNLKRLVSDVSMAVRLLREWGYTVQRYKIESTVYDSKFEDKFGLLNDFDVNTYVTALEKRTSYAQRIRV